jgi:hypothetical protein
MPRAIARKSRGISRWFRGPEHWFTSARGSLSDLLRIMCGQLCQWPGDHFVAQARGRWRLIAWNKSRHARIGRRRTGAKSRIALRHGTGRLNELGCSPKNSRNAPNSAPNRRRSNSSEPSCPSTPGYLVRMLAVARRDAPSASTFLGGRRCFSVSHPPATWTDVMDRQQPALRSAIAKTQRTAS